MKKVVCIVSVFAALSLITACGGKGEKKSSVKVSTDMQDFMNNLNGKSASVTVALESFGKAGLEDQDMDMYDLKDPEVLEAKDNCYLLRCSSGMTKRKYNLCWEGGKIASIEDKGME